MEIVETVEELGPDEVLEVALEWWREGRHHGIALKDMGTTLPNWDAVLVAVVQVVMDREHPLRDDPAVRDFALYLECVKDDRQA